MAKVTVVGSSNMDLVATTDRLPKSGETIFGESFLKNIGGKGTNQAVAASRLGGEVTFVSCLGKDAYGRKIFNHLVYENIDTNHIFFTEEQPTGIALITVQKNAENSIIVISGANNYLSPKMINETKSTIKNSDIILLQLEIPKETSTQVITLCKRMKKRVILNPAPARTLDDTILDGLFAITPNQSEAKILTGIEVIDVNSAKKAALMLKKKGVQNIIITMGKKGVFLLNDDYSKIIPTLEVKAIDTTAAGDTFNGALAVQIAKKRSMYEAIGFANMAAALSVTRKGTQSAIPYLNELIK